MTDKEKSPVKTRKAKDAEQQPLTHLDAQGHARMVDVSQKESTERSATAESTLLMKPGSLRLIVEGKAPKGDVLGVARIAGIMAAKKTDTLIPLCHSIAISSVEIRFEPQVDLGLLHIEAQVKCIGNTGVEMEALAAVTISALTIYDMLKAVDRSMTIRQIGLMEKRGGRSGTWIKE